MPRSLGRARCQSPRGARRRGAAAGCQRPGGLRPVSLASRRCLPPSGLQPFVTVVLDQGRGKLTPHRRGKAGAGELREWSRHGVRAGGRQQGSGERGGGRWVRGVQVVLPESGRTASSPAPRCHSGRPPAGGSAASPSAPGGRLRLREGAGGGGGGKHRRWAARGGGGLFLGGISGHVRAGLEERSTGCRVFFSGGCLSLSGRGGGVPGRGGSPRGSNGRAGGRRGQAAGGGPRRGRPFGDSLHGGDGRSTGLVLLRSKIAGRSGGGPGLAGPSAGSPRRVSAPPPRTAVRYRRVLALPAPARPVAFLKISPDRWKLCLSRRISAKPEGGPRVGVCFLGPKLHPCSDI